MVWTCNYHDTVLSKKWIMGKKSHTCKIEGGDIKIDLKLDANCSFINEQLC